MRGILRLACVGYVAAYAATSFGQGRMIAISSGRTLYEMDLATGAATAIGAVGSNASTTAGLAYDAANEIMYLTSTGNDSIYTLDLGTGNASLIGPYGDSAVVMHGIEYDDSTGTIYTMSSHNTGSFYRVNKTTGAATLIGTTGTANFQNLGYDSDHDVMYMTQGGTPESLHIIDRTTGGLTLVGLLGTLSTNPNGLAYNRDNHTMYMVDNTTHNFCTINLSTGAASLVGNFGSINMLGLAYIPAKATVSGSVELQNLIPDESGKAVTFEVLEAGSTVQTKSVTLGASGVYAFQTGRTGTYDLGLKRTHWLRKVVTGVNLTGGGTSTVSFSLINGDVDGDNEITLADYGLLATAFGTVDGDPNWNPNADLDEDGEVTLADYAILSTNFGQAGD